jgi:hypothetical protein
MGFATFRESVWIERQVPRFRRSDVAITTSSAPVLSDRTARLWLASQRGPAPVGSGRGIGDRLPRSPIPLLPTCLTADLERASPLVQAKDARCRASHVRRLVRARTTLPWLLPWDAHPRAPLLMRLVLFSSFLLPLWRHALRRFLLASSRTASPRSVPSRLPIASSRHSCCHERRTECSQQATRP